MLLWLAILLRQTGWMSEFGHKLFFDKEGIAVCPESKNVYNFKME